MARSINLKKHILEQPFVFATGLAALIHSTWSLGTLFSGHEPQQFTIPWFGWLLPALLISFSLDVGQIVTSAEIRAGQRGPAKFATFFVFAAATYYLQWIYIASHMPALDLAPGIRAAWADTAQVLRDSAVWFVPALLPLSTLLYTFSQEQPMARPPERLPVDQPQKDMTPLHNPTKAVLLPATEAVESEGSTVLQEVVERPFLARLNPNGRGDHITQR